MVVKWVEKKAFATSLENPLFFRTVVRPAAYLLAKGDPEVVHEMALEALNEYEDVLEEKSNNFSFPRLRVQLANKKVGAFGTAAGLDKNANAIGPLSHIVGFQECGTFVIPKRPGNDRPRIAVDEEHENLYNAQGFPSKGCIYAQLNLGGYRESLGKGVIYASICGIPSDSEGLGVAFRDTEKLLSNLDSLVDGFVWNPFSPNTTTLTALRNPEIFEQYAKRIRETAGNRLALVKMGPYESSQRTSWLDLVRGWMKGGGDGVVVVNTYVVPKERVPSKEWGYQSAGVSGRFLQEYRQRAIIDIRSEFPKAIIVATGGVNSSEQAWAAFEAGANVLEGYTPYTFHGFGLLQQMARGVEEKLNALGYDSLAEFQEKKWVF
ncbi:hypothetical protein HYT51_02445 [Candidatus Woesearchaeota archaeon]|nr:hypothetical protein [Candidatus Woesearchaeota archaeon]